MGLSIFDIARAQSNYGSGFGQKWIEKIQTIRKTKIWTEPTKFGEPIAEIEAGVALELLSYSTTGTWARVSTPQGREGYVLVRHTNLSGRRGEGPLNANDEALKSAQNEFPNSRSIASTAERELSDFDIGLDLGYSNQLNRSQASGFQSGLSFDYALNNQWTLGLGLDYNYFRDSARDDSISAQTSRTTNRFFPHARLRMVESYFDFILGIGFDIDKTTFSTLDTVTGEPIITNSQGLYVSGTENNTSLGVKIQPKYWFPIGSQSYFGLYANLGLTIQFGTGTGIFAGSPTNKVVTQLGAGATFSKGF